MRVYCIILKWVYILKADNRAVSAIEFALVLPVMLTILVGSVEFGRALDNKRKVASLARTLADLTSQAATTEPVAVSAMNDILASSRLVLRPFDSTSVKIVVSAAGVGLKSIAGNPTICSSFSSSNTAARSVGAAGDLSIPAGFRVLGMRYIISEVQMAYAPLFGSALMKFLSNTESDFTFKSIITWPVRAGATYKTSTYNEIILPNGTACSL